MNTVIFSLFQHSELDRAKKFIAQVSKYLGSNRALYILINDEDCPSLRSYGRSISKHIKFFCENKNLGVASGRNYLLRKALEDGAEFFISCDNDILVENNYFQKIEESFLSLKKRHGKVGLIQPVLLDGRRYKECLGISDISSWDELDSKSLSFSFAELRRNFERHYGKRVFLSSIFHAGISNALVAHFAKPPESIRYPEFFDNKSRFKTNLFSLRADPDIFKRLLDIESFVEVQTTAGGVSAFHKDLLEGNGFYNSKFDPFCYEDSEFSFRAFHNGFQNFVCLKVCAIHDVFGGEGFRRPLQLANIARLRGVESSILKSDDILFRYAMGQSVAFGWRELARKLISEFNIKANDQFLPSHFLFNYLLNFIFGRFSRLKNFPSEDFRGNVFSAMFSDLLKDNVHLRVSIPLGPLNFNIDKFRIDRTSEGEKEVFSLFGLNCRFETSGSTALRNSRYFDLYVRAKHLDNQKYQVNINFQSNDQTYSLRFSLDLSSWISAPENFAPKAADFVFEQKKYDFGPFSEEDIFPAPGLNCSNEAVSELLAQLTFFASEIDCSIMSKVESVLRNYFDDNHPLFVPKKKILIFTDSRGQHKPAGSTHQIFAEKLQKDPRLDVDMFLCPMKWTTTLDFIEQFNQSDLEKYDHVILYTGIVDWSPRPQLSAMNDLYNNNSLKNLKNLDLNTRDYSKKIVNNKKEIFDSIFGESTMGAYLGSPFDTKYEGQNTINMYSLEMGRERILPHLKAIKNLIYISANRFVTGWEGDFKRGRPGNITITHQYSDLFSNELGPDKVIDLRCWTADEIKEFTCDNIHLTEAGSEYVYKEVLSRLGFSSDHESVPVTNLIAQNYEVNKTAYFPIRMPANAEDRIPLTSSKGINGYLATVIIPFRLSGDDPARLDNLEFTLAWLDRFWPGLFDIVLVEQDEEPKLRETRYKLRENERYRFLFNPKDFNRGWGFNVAIKHFCEESSVLILMDTDVLPGSNFLEMVESCSLGKYKFISPYQNVYYTSESEASEVRRDFSTNSLSRTEAIKNPVTISGGILIADRQSFLDVNGFEQYIGYGCEDRALDVTMLAMFGDSDIYVAPELYVHLYHPSDQSGRRNFWAIYEHMTRNYRCFSNSKLNALDYIHRDCEHSNRVTVSKLAMDRLESFADIDLYRKSGRLLINGQRKSLDPMKVSEITIPPSFSDLSSYRERELYSAPDPDLEELKDFHNAYLGERCFIIGNGPSLNKHDLSLLEGEYTFGVNSLFYKTRETGFRPYFYVVEDSSVIKENVEEIINYDVPYKFLPTVYKKLHPKKPNTTFFTMNRGFYEKSSPNYAVPRFSTDATKELYCGQSVTYINLQLAYFMGFTEVYLIGMDFSYIIPKSHKRVGDVLTSDTDDPNHFHKDYFGKGKTWKDPKLERVGNNYRMAKVVYESVGRKIYNATIGGSLEIFDRVDYESLFESRTQRSSSVDMVGLEKASFRKANSLYRERRFSDALVQYIHLYECRPTFSLYRDAAINAYLKAESEGQPIQVELVSKIKSYLAL